MLRREFLARIAALAGGVGLLNAVPAGARDAVRKHETLRGAAANASARPAARKDASLTLVVAGDTTLGYNVETHVDALAAIGIAPSTTLPAYFARMAPVFDAADVRLVNLECPFTDRGKPLPKNFNFRAPPAFVKSLQAGRVDVASMANNHVSDFGSLGVMDTVRTLNHAGIAHFGGGATLAEARRPVVLKRNGVRLGLIGYYFQSADDMREPAELYATARRAGTAGCYTDLDCMRRMVEEDVAKLLPRVDALVPYFHWGKEGAYDVQGYQVDLAHLCVDLGCKAVVGTHPHRAQAIEVYRGAPIFYSVGNFVFGGIKDPSDRLGLVARIRLRAGQSAEGEVIPIYTTTWPDAPFQPYPLEGVEREDAMAALAWRSSVFASTLPPLDPALHPIPPATDSADSTRSADQPGR